MYTGQNTTGTRQHFGKILTTSKRRSRGNILSLPGISTPLGHRARSEEAQRSGTPSAKKMEDLDMLDIRLRKGKYTWSNRRVRIGNVATRLDKVGSSFLQKDLLPTFYAFPSAVSDHKPLALILSLPVNIGPISFRFNLIWLHDVKIMDLIQREWNTHLLGSLGYIWIPILEQ